MNMCFGQLDNNSRNKNRLSFSIWKLTFVNSKEQKQIEFLHLEIDFCNILI